MSFLQRRINYQCKSEFNRFQGYACLCQYSEGGGEGKAGEPSVSASLFYYAAPSVLDLHAPQCDVFLFVMPISSFPFLSPITILF